MEVQMMKVLLVDDESYIVEYLKHLIRWQEFSFFEVLGFSDPLEAKERLNKADIDLLITDIAMPEINGIDLLRFIHDKQLPTATIFLSSYSEFEYAQQAIRYGLAEYLLKPITKESLEKSLRNVLERLNFQTAEIKEKPMSLERLLFSQLAMFPVEYSTFGKEEYCFFQMAACPNDNTLAYWKKRENESYGIVSISESVSSYKKISKKFLGNQSDLWRQEFYSFFYQIEFYFGKFSVLGQRLKLYFIKLMNHERLSQSYHEFYPKFTEEEKLIFLVNSIAFLFFYGEQETVRKIDIFNLKDIMQQKQVLDLLQEYYTKHYQVFSVKEIIQKTNQYILANLEKNLSLEVLANRAFLNPAYFSTLYKQETGINISTYVQDARLDQSVKLLIETNLKIKDIGEMSGYPHTQYFTKVFKERYGITPNRYRKRNI